MADIFTFSGKEFSTEADILSKFDSGDIGGTGWTFDPNKGVKSAGALVCSTNGNDLRLRLRDAGLTPTEKTFRMVLWYKGTGAPSSSILFTLGNTSKSNPYHISLDSNGAIAIYATGSNGFGTTQRRGLGLINIHDGNFHCIQIELIEATGAGGSMKIWVDGVLDIGYSGSTVAINSSAYIMDRIDYIDFKSPSNGCELSHIKIWDDNSGGLTGDIGNNTPYVYVHTVTASGDVSAFSAIGAATDWEAIDESGMYDDTTYIEGYNGDEVLFQISDLPATVVSVLSLSIESVAKAEAGTFIDMEFRTKLSGGLSTTIGTKTVNGNDNYKRYEQGQDSLTVNDINLMQVGIKLTATP